MTTIEYTSATVPVRADIERAHARCWLRMASPGTWLSGAQRVAIAAETRHSLTCNLCQRRTEALSPTAVEGLHDTAGVLPPSWVEVIHRVRTDSARLSHAWFETVVPDLLSEECYAELVGVVANVTTVDSFCIALGVAQHALPQPKTGEPSRRRPIGAKPGLAWLHTVAPEDVASDDPPMYAGKGGANIHRALSLVPDEVVGFFDLDDVHYLPDAQLRDFAHEPRSITHAQIELLAARVSALNQCVY